MLIVEFGSKRKETFKVELVPLSPQYNLTSGCLEDKKASKDIQMSLLGWKFFQILATSTMNKKWGQNW